MRSPSETGAGLLPRRQRMADKKMEDREMQKRLAAIRRLARPGSGEGAVIRLKEIAGVATGAGDYGKPDDIAERLAAGQASVAIRTSERNKDRKQKKERAASKGRDRILTTGRDRGAA